MVKNASIDSFLASMRQRGAGGTWEVIPGGSILCSLFVYSFGRACTIDYGVYTSEARAGRMNANIARLVGLFLPIRGCCVEPFAGMMA